MLRAQAALVLCAVLCAEPVSAQAIGTAAAPQAVPASDAVPAAYDAEVLAGTRQIVIRDFVGALTSLRTAAGREASRPEAFCRLGDAQIVQGDVGEARAAYQSCERFAAAEKNTHHTALALVGLARVWALENKPAEELEAWKRVASTVQEELALTLAKERIAVLEAVLKQEAAYQGVRARIAERVAAAAAKATP